MPPGTRGRNADLIRAQKYGFWVGTKLMPRRAVRWEATVHEDGRTSLRGRNWVEVLEHGETRQPERFHAADVELVGPSEWLTYYPGVEEPVCGWMDRPGHYCPRAREVTDGAVQPFCPRHEAELQGSEGEEEHARGNEGSHAE